MRILVTNDDGVSAPGLFELTRALDDDGFDVIVVAPLTDCSGFGTAVSGFHRDPVLTYERLTFAGLSHVPVFGVDGPPASAVMAACLGGFGSPPRLVVSGINAGLNVGGSVLHSGTVGAALTAARLHRAALAVSLDTTGASEPHWPTATAVATTALEWLLDREVNGVFNINVPAVPLGALRGILEAAVEPPTPSHAAFVSDGVGRLRLQTWARDDEPSPGTDTAALAAGYAAISQLAHSWAGAPPLDTQRLAAGLQATTSRLLARRQRAACRDETAQLDRAG